MRHILADNALAASGDCLLELSAFVAEGTVSDHPTSTKAPQVCRLQTGASHQRTLFYLLSIGLVWRTGVNSFRISGNESGR